MSLPLDSIHECFALNFPDCMGKITECPNLIECHKEYSGVVQKDLLSSVDDNRFWMNAFAGLILSVPIIYMILLFIWSVI